MMDSLFRMNDVKLFVSLTCMAIVLSVIVLLLVRKFISLPQRYKDNTVVGNTANVIAVIYGVLADLSALYLINNNSYAADAVQREANAVADIYRDSSLLDRETGSAIETELKLYLAQVINVEWPMLEAGNDVDSTGDVILDKITNELVQYSGTGNAGSLLVRDMMDSVKSLYDARHQRINIADSGLTPELWMVIIIGTLLTLCINCLFGMDFRMHVITMIAIAIMTSSMIFLLITLERPFQGEFVIQPDAFKEILTHMK